jgi:WD40 repeat protein
VLHLWDLATGRDRAMTPEAHELTMTRLLCAEGGKTLITGSDDGTARVWDLETGRQRAVLRHKGWVRALALSPDGKLLATGAHHPDSHVRLWHLATGKELRSWPGRGRSEAAVALTFTTDGDGLLSLWRDGSIRRFEVATGDEVPTVQPRLSRTRVDPFLDSSLDFGLFSPRGALTAASAQGNGLHVADTATGRELYKVPANTFSFAFSADGKTLAVAENVSARTKLADGRTRNHPGEGVIRLLDAMTGKEQRKITHQASYFSSLAFAPDGEVLAAALGDKTNTIRLYRTEDGRELHALRGHDAHTSSLCFTPDGRSLVSGLQDTTVLLWDVPKNP